MKKPEREFLLLHLAENRERLLEAVDGLGKEQQRFRPAPGRWSVADCVEHVSIVEKLVLKNIQRVVTLTPEPQTRASVADHVMLTEVSNRSARCPAPPEAMPSKRWTDFEELLRQFESWRERSLRFAAVTQADLRIHFFEHPRLGELDCYQWILFLGAHSDRHVLQIEEVIGDPGFPHEADSAIA
jgi:uncharacterized damage-inducible protein DinB